MNQAIPQEEHTSGSRPRRVTVNGTIRVTCEFALILCAIFAGQYLALLWHWDFGRHHPFTCDTASAIIGTLLVRGSRRAEPEQSTIRHLG